MIIKLIINYLKKVMFKKLKDYIIVKLAIIK